ncbi:hypothetical protein SAMN05216597_5766 [Pseudomonas cannabina]|nr:hypothetical protein SAMN05216597_5766 [Pseudomonas cannabina]
MAKDKCSELIQKRCQAEVVRNSILNLRHGQLPLFSNSNSTFQASRLSLSFAEKALLFLGLTKPLSFSVIPSVRSALSSASFKALPNNSENILNLHDGHSSVFPVASRMPGHRGQLSGASKICSLEDVSLLDVLVPEFSKRGLVLPVVRSNERRAENFVFFSRPIKF